MFLKFPDLKHLQRSEISPKARMIMDEIERYGYRVLTMQAHFGYYEQYGKNYFVYRYNHKDNTHEISATIGMTIPDIPCVNSYKMVIISLGALKVVHKFDKKTTMVNTLLHELAHVIDIHKNPIKKLYLTTNRNHVNQEKYHDQSFNDIFQELCEKYRVKLSINNNYLDKI